MAQVDELIAARYRLQAHVGQGAMGVVWLAEDDRLRRPVALKAVSLPPWADERAREQAHRRVMREGRMIARLHHPHAIAVYDVVEHDEQPWLVMEYLPSRSLAEVLAAEGPLAPDHVSQVGRQVAAALAAAHEAGIVHRDVKPGNVLLGDGGTVKVTDFGIARAVDDVTITSAGTMAGTPAYLAPEVARGATADFRSDVYSLGSTIYAALEGGPPFGAGENALAQLHRVATGDYAPPRRAGPLTPLLTGLLAPEPARRPGMHEVRDELARLASAEAGTDEGPVTPLLPRPAPVAVTGPTDASSLPPSTTTPVVATAPGSGPLAPVPPPPPDPVPPADPGPQPVGAPRRRRRGAWVAGGVVLVVLVAAVVVGLLGTQGVGPGASLGRDATGPGAGVSDGSGASGGSSAGGGAPFTGSAEQQAQQQAVVDYYGLLPGDLDTGWQRLTPQYQRSTAGGFAGYTGFWRAIRQVDVRDVAPGDTNSVDATVVYDYADGREVVERTRFTLVQQDGRWAIDQSQVLSSR